MARNHSVTEITPEWLQRETHFAYPNKKKDTEKISEDEMLLI